MSKVAAWQVGVLADTDRASMTQEEPRDTGAVNPSADATDSTVTALLNEAGVLIDSAETYRAGKLHEMANEKIAAALRLIKQAQVMMQREGA